MPVQEKPVWMQLRGTVTVPWSISTGSGRANSRNPTVKLLYIFIHNDTEF